MSTKYRIFQKKDDDGQTRFAIQESFFHFFWRWLEVPDTPFSCGGILKFDTLEQAKKYIGETRGQSNDFVFHSEL